MRDILAAAGLLLAIEAAGTLCAGRPAEPRHPAARLAASLVRGMAVLMAAAAVLLLAPSAWRTGLFWAAAALAVLIRCVFSVKNPPLPSFPRSGLWPAGLLLALGGIAYGRCLFAGPLDTMDFLTTYGLRAKILLLSPSGLGALFDRYRTPWHGFYPPGLPLLYAGSAIAFGRWDETLLAIVPAAAAAAALLAVFGFLAESRVDRLPAVLWSAVAALSPGLWAATEVGHAEVPLAAALAVGAAAVLLGARFPGRRSELRWAAAAACLLKNEGLPAAALLLAADLWQSRDSRKSRRAIGHVLAVLPGVGWIVASSLARFPRDTGGFPRSAAELTRALARIPAVAGLLGKVLALSVGGPVLVFLALVPLLALRRAARGEPLARASAVACALAAQIAVFAGVYLVSPYPAVWLMWLSVERILAPVSFAGVLVIASLGAPAPAE